MIIIMNKKLSRMNNGTLEEIGRVAELVADGGGGQAEDGVVGAQETVENVNSDTIAVEIRHLPQHPNLTRTET